ncbi:MAG: hypothetical protein MJZ81_10725 [Bacteroidales bacterium]|nr:hypothetical protein [Bacteroidales bacterium]
MKNFEKYKNQNDLIKAFFKNRSPSSISVAIIEEFSKWREMEAEEEKILPCPFCGGNVQRAESLIGKKRFSCSCGYTSKAEFVWDKAIAAHNRVAKVVMEAKKEGESK